MLKNDGNQKLKFFKPSDLAWNAPIPSSDYLHSFASPEQKQTTFFQNMHRQLYQPANIYVILHLLVAHSLSERLR